MAVCKINDDFIAEKLKWIVTLSNKEKVYQDDYRPGQTQPIAWLRLKNYINDHKLSIVKFEIQFITHIEEAAPPNKPGYYFVQAADAIAFSGHNSTYRYYIVGYLENDGKIYTTKWMVPEIIQISKDVREVEKDDPKLIINKD